MRTKTNWTFEEVIIGLFNRFVLPMVMQDTSEAFFNTKYTSDKGVQGFYDEIMDHAQNMADYPHHHMVRDVFVRGLPDKIRSKLFDNGLNVEYTHLDTFVREAKAKELADKMASYYNRKNAIQAKDVADHKPTTVKVGTTLIAKSALQSRLTRFTPRHRARDDRTRPSAKSKEEPCKEAVQKPVARFAGQGRIPQGPELVPGQAQLFLDDCWNCGEKGH